MVINCKRFSVVDDVGTHVLATTALSLTHTERWVTDYFIGPGPNAASAFHCSVPCYRFYVENLLIYKMPHTNTNTCLSPQLCVCVWKRVHYRHTAQLPRVLPVIHVTFWSHVFNTLLWLFKAFKLFDWNLIKCKPLYVSSFFPSQVGWPVGSSFQLLFSFVYLSR